MTDEPLSEEVFKRVLPRKLHGSVSPAVIHNINNVITDATIREAYKENILSFTHVLADGKFKIQSYLDAVKYISYKMFGCPNIEAYTKTFPERYQRYLDDEISPKDIASYVSSYNKNKLVNLVLEQTLVPTHILNAHVYQAAINVQHELMRSAKSEKVRSDAANSLLTHLKMPETQKVELDITVKEDKAITELKATTQKLVAAQRAQLETGGMTATEIAHSKLEVVNPDEDIEEAEIVEEDDYVEGDFTRAN